ncbi:hypothetical protein LNTAR_24354 [Lentisphaera araneosa HTCC2155]|jgi:hypothetical protein|uniref:Uncharacterized protein n=1 Tax=Lentisphaera araneosa HTCC2155 TaxID=313628 RepID=A6DQ59_9BACT|nr:hypothetical protein [Lentisphaera araneosa]EDM26300.1 hypothetical protein LNTAR_24354 [Lentisphaera araneosa HTCC2155]
MIKKLVISLLICLSVQADKIDDWNTVRLEFHRLSLDKINKDIKLKSLDRRVKSLYIKLDELFKRNDEMKNLVASLKGKLGKDRQVVIKKINALQDKLIASDALLAEEQKEIIEKINKLNEEIYIELMKDPKLVELESKLKKLEN